MYTLLASVSVARYPLTNCENCGKKHLSWSIAAVRRAMERQATLSDGNGIIMCRICDLPLSAHDLGTHKVGERSGLRLRSSGVPWSDRTAQLRQHTTARQRANE
jgi:hypothetical protein